jgi:two-component system sensor histidine kinase AtoS
LNPTGPDSSPSPPTPPREATNFVIDALGGDLAGRRLSLADLTENTLDAVLFLDQDSTVRYWNLGARMMFQYEREEVIGRHVGFLLPADLVQCRELERLKAACDLDGVIYNHLTRRVRKDGRQLWVSLTRTVLHDDQGRAIGAVATLRDITEQRSKESELRRARELAMVGELAAKIAHEVKNPLAGIFAALQVLEGGLETSDPRREIFASIGDEVMRLNDITQSLLGFARPSDPKLKRGELRRFLHEFVRDLERLSMIEPGAVQLALPTELWIEFDAALTAEVLKNLILNAVQATKGRGKVVLRSSTSANLVAIDVADSGPGVPSAQRAAIFEPFFTTKARGTGLGLAIARKNMEAQGGGIRLRNQRGPGATFRLEFPQRAGADSDSL